MKIIGPRPIMSSVTTVIDNEGNRRNISLPTDMRPGKFKTFLQGFYNCYRDGEDVSAEEAAIKLHFDEEIARKYLRFMVEVGLVKPVQKRPYTRFKVGCPPPQELLARLEYNEGKFAESWFDFGQRALGFLRPWRIVPSELPWEDKVSLLKEWYEKDRYYLETNLLLALGSTIGTLGGFLILCEVEKLIRNNYDLSPSTLNQ